MQWKATKEPIGVTKQTAPVVNVNTTTKRFFITTSSMWHFTQSLFEEYQTIKKILFANNIKGFKNIKLLN